jgi:hypothetical protein
MAKASSNTGKMAAKYATLGFGVPATSDPHHFKVIVPKSNNGQVQINEYLGLQAQSDEFAVIERLVLDRSRWTAIRAEVQRAFNARLKSYDLKTSTWQVGENLVDRLLGKELCVLAWAVEQMDIENISVAVRNWLALRPEERWWLFGMTAKSTGGVDDRDVGWRVALRHALGDIVQAEQSELTQVPELSPERQSGRTSDSSSSSEDHKALPEIDDIDVSYQQDSNKTTPVADEIGSEQHSIAEVPTTEESLFLFEAKQARAIGLPVGDKSNPEFLVKKGSSANIAMAKSLRPAIRELRQQLLDQNILAKQGEVYSFTHEYLFKSPSAAACVIAGNPRSGMDAWKDMQGHSLKDLGYGKKA